jgi:hypothetical protein
MRQDALFNILALRHVDMAEQAGRRCGSSI